MHEGCVSIMNERSCEPEEREKKIEAIRSAFGRQFGSVSLHPELKEPPGGGGDGDMPRRA